jgi:hypothetical protein
MLRMPKGMSTRFQQIHDTGYFIELSIQVNRLHHNIIRADILRNIRLKNCLPFHHAVLLASLHVLKQQISSHISDTDHR